MAYMDQKRKAERAPKIKAVANKYGIKVSIGVKNYSTLVVKIKSGKLDFITNYNNTVKHLPGNYHMVDGHIDVNEFHIERHYTGACKDCLLELLDAMKGDDYFDKSDIMTDYFHSSHYNDIRIGEYNKDYVIIE